MAMMVDVETTKLARAVAAANRAVPAPAVASQVESQVESQVASQVVSRGEIVAIAAIAGFVATRKTVDGKTVETVAETDVEGAAGMAEVKLTEVVHRRRRLRLRMGTRAGILAVKMHRRLPPHPHR